MQAEEYETVADPSAVATTISRLRNRAWLLRFQAYAAIGVILAAVLGLSWLFSSLHRLAMQHEPVESKPREPYDYRLMESRHTILSDKLKEFSTILSDSKQELISDKYGKAGGNQEMISKLMQARVEELGALRAEIDDRLSKDRQNMYLELTRMREERDLAIREGGERRMMLRLAGDAVLRVGILVLAIYFISILSNIAKYWLRVADHLNSVADSLDLLKVSGLSLSPAIAALTPHPIDFQVDNVLSLRSLKEMVPILGSTPSKAKSD